MNYKYSNYEEIKIDNTWYFICIFRFLFCSGLFFGQNLSGELPQADVQSDEV
jgi:hypothetical protein